MFSEPGDEHGLCSALRLRAWRALDRGAAEARGGGVGAGGRACAQRAALEHERIEILGWIASSLFFGPDAVPPRAIRRCEAIRAEVEGNLAATADVLQPLAGLHAMEGRFDEARELLRGERRRLRGARADAELGRLAPRRDGGDARRRRRAPRSGSLRKGYAALEEMGDRALLSTTAAYLGQALLAQGRDDEAERFAELSAELAADDDVITQAMWRGVRASVLAARGRSRRGRAAGAAGRRPCGADRFPEPQGGGALRTSPTCCARSGRPRAPRRCSGEALGLYEQKGNLVAAGRLRGDLAPSAPV